MANTSAMCTSFKSEVAQGLHNFTTTTGNVFKVALYTSSASLGASTTAYSATNEVSGAGYSAGGFAWTAAQNITPQTSGTTAYWSWSTNPSWAASSITANAALIYNSTNSNRAVASIAFGGDFQTSGGTFTIQLPTNDSSNAILRFA